MTARRVILAPRLRTATADAKKASGSQSLERGLDVLEMIAAESGDIGVRELARRSALSPTIVQRLVSSLARRGYIEKNSETSRYRLGHQSLALAASGEGVALARSLLARSDIEAGRLVPLFDLAIRDRFAYWLVIRPGIERRRDVSAFTEWIRRECIDSVGPPVLKKVAPARSNISKRKRKVRAYAQGRRAPNRDYPRRNVER